LHNCHKSERGSHEQGDDVSESQWITPQFINIKKRKTKRLSPYSESEIWDRDDLLTAIKYEPYKRNKAALSLLWDLVVKHHVCGCNYADGKNCPWCKKSCHHDASLAPRILISPM